MAKIDMKTAFVFPGQGSQAVGMGRDLAEAFPAARLVFEEVDEALKQNLSRLMFEGPDEELRLTENAQPGLMAVSLAVIAVLEEECNVKLADKAAFVAGHSLGEYSALAAAGALRVDEAARLLKLRGQSMQKAVPVGEGAMAALLGLDLDAAQAVAEEASAIGVCDCANDNAPGQIVVSGATAAVERAVELAAERGAKRSIMLPVSAPFHCAMMQPAADVMEEALAGVTVEEPLVPLVANVTAHRVEDPEEIRRLLVQQVTAMVRWRETVLYMKEQEVELLVEAGAGKVLSGLTRRIDRELSSKSLQVPSDFDDFAKQL
jgi:[acyl-carrier-protein] S-malonyltransferase